MTNLGTASPSIVFEDATGAAQYQLPERTTVDEHSVRTFWSGVVASVALGITCAGGTGSTGLQISDLQKLYTGSTITITIDQSAGPNLETASEAVFTTERRIARIRRALSLNVTQVALALAVSRPTVYEWVEGQRVPRRESQDRLKALSDLAEYWESLCSDPVGRHVITPLSDGGTLVDYLAETPLDLAKVRSALVLISNVAKDEQRARESTGATAINDFLMKRRYVRADDDSGNRRVGQASPRSVSLD
jgi:DNA-binding transcriptional regulator YiaG